MGEGVEAPALTDVIWAGNLFLVFTGATEGRTMLDDTTQVLEGLGMTWKRSSLEIRRGTHVHNPQRRLCEGGFPERTSKFRRRSSSSVWGTPWTPLGCAMARRASRHGCCSLSVPSSWNPAEQKDADPAQAGRAQSRPSG